MKSLVVCLVAAACIGLLAVSVLASEPAAGSKDDPEGACCVVRSYYAMAECFLATESGCSVQGGEWHGEGSSCDMILCTCCTGESVGDLDQSGQPYPYNVDGADLAMMISGMFIQIWPPLWECTDEADVDFSCGRPCSGNNEITGIDLAMMIDALFISLDPLPQCDGTPN